MSVHNPLEGDKPDLTFKISDITTDEKVSIIIIHNDRPEYLNICLQTLTVTTVNTNYEIIVVDNGSVGEKSHAFLNQLEQDGIKIVRNSTNLWWTKAANQGARTASKDSKYLIFLHYDMNFISNIWLDTMIYVAQGQKSGMVGLKNKVYEINKQKISFIDESCILVSRECWDSCGPFNEELPQEGSPFVFHFLAVRKGFKPTTIDQKTQLLVHHYSAYSVDTSKHLAMIKDMEPIVIRLIHKIQSEYN